MNTTAFKPGDVVTLKSGGPQMAVEGYDPAGKVICHYFTTQHQGVWFTCASDSESYPRSIAC
jgi:uncharacterized protein YodC (DUF2158 family)